MPSDSIGINRKTRLIEIHFYKNKNEIQSLYKTIYKQLSKNNKATKEIAAELTVISHLFLNDECDLFIIQSYKLPSNEQILIDLWLSNFIKLILPITFKKR